MRTVNTLIADVKTGVCTLAEREAQVLRATDTTDASVTKLDVNAAAFFLRRAELSHDVSLPLDVFGVSPALLLIVESCPSISSYSMYLVCVVVDPASNGDGAAHNNLFACRCPRREVLCEGHSHSLQAPRIRREQGERVDYVTFEGFFLCLIPRLPALDCARADWGDTAHRGEEMARIMQEGKC